MSLPVRAYDRTVNPELERLVYQEKVILQEAEGLVWNLSDDQFNWSPAAGVWSIAQCLDHLNICNAGFVREFEESIRKARANGITGNGPYTYGFLARWFMRLMGPPVKSRFKAPRNLQPAPRRTLEEVLAEWQKTHDRLVLLLGEANGIDLARAKVRSPAASWLSYGLGAGFWIQTAHDRRHLWQARQIRNHALFPAS